MCWRVQATVLNCRRLACNKAPTINKLQRRGCGTEACDVHSEACRSLLSTHYIICYFAYVQHADQLALMLLQTKAALAGWLLFLFCAKHTKARSNVVNNEKRKNKYPPKSAFHYCTQQATSASSLLSVNGGVRVASPEKKLSHPCTEYSSSLYDVTCKTTTCVIFMCAHAALF